MIQQFKMVPRAGLEPARYRYRWILSPLRLPISPPGHCLTIISKDRMSCKDFFKKPLKILSSQSKQKKCILKQMHYNMSQYHFLKYSHTQPSPLIRHIVFVWLGQNDKLIHNCLAIGEFLQVKKPEL